jgi:hypothetical protein
MSNAASLASWLLVLSFTFLGQESLGSHETSIRNSIFVHEYNVALQYPETWADPAPGSSPVPVVLSRGHRRLHENYYCHSWLRGVTLTLPALGHSGRASDLLLRGCRTRVGTSCGHGRLMRSKLQREDQGEAGGSQADPK